MSLCVCHCSARRGNISFVSEWKKTVVSIDETWSFLLDLNDAQDSQMLHKHSDNMLDFVSWWESMMVEVILKLSNLQCSDKAPANPKMGWADCVLKSSEKSGIVLTSWTKLVRGFEIHEKHFLSKFLKWAQSECMAFHLFFIWKQGLFALNCDARLSISLGFWLNVSLKRIEFRCLQCQKLSSNCGAFFFCSKIELDCKTNCDCQSKKHQSFKHFGFTAAAIQFWSAQIQNFCLRKGFLQQNVGNLVLLSQTLTAFF